MNSKIVETLELMCNKENPQDKKILLLAELVESKCTALGRNQGDLKKSLDDTNTKLDKLTALLERYEHDTHDCPVYKHKDTYEWISLIAEYPRATIIIVLSVIAVLGGFFGTNLTNLLEKLF